MRPKQCPVSQAWSWLVDFLILIILLVLSAAFSGMETALFSLGQAEIARLERGHGSAGQKVGYLLRRANDLLSALLIGNLVVNTAASVTATSLCLRLFGAKGVVIAVPAVTLLLLLLGEITPKMLALRYRMPIALVAQAPLGIWLKLTRPFLMVAGLLTGTVIRLLPFEPSGTRLLTPEELQTACDLAVEDGSLTETEGRSLGRLIRLEDLEVSRIMTPRTSVVSLRRGMSLQDVLTTARQAGFNRYPVLETEGDRPVGFIHLKDLLTGDQGTDQPLEGPLRQLLFVPESKGVAALLTEMRAGGGHLASVVDEHGDFTGIVTMADCLQAVMGPVMDGWQHDAEMIPLGGGRWVISGRTDLRELEETCGVILPEGRDYVTVAGFMMARLGRVLQPGDKVTLDQARFSVLEMTGHRVDRIGLTLLSEGRIPGSDQGGAA
jgi:putative hemolysin